MSATSLQAFFGDAEHSFDFDAALLGELETLTDAGIGALFQRLVNRAFRYADLLAVIRLGLIGGGKRPEEAARLVKVYGEGRPIEETYPVAVAILSALWFGAAPDAAPGLELTPAPAPAAEPATIPEPAPTAEPAPASEPTPAPDLMDIGSEH